MPSFEPTGSAFTVRTNGCVNPRPRGVTTGWSASAGTVTTGADGLTTTASIVTTPYVFSAARAGGATLGRIYAMSMKVKGTPVVGQTNPTSASIRPHKNTGNAYYTPDGGTITVPMDGVQRLVQFYWTATVNIPEAEFFNITAVASGSAPVGFALSVDEVLIEEVPIKPATFPTFFTAGVPSTDPDMVTAWAGAANTTASLLVANGINTYVSSAASGVQSSIWHAEGTHSLRQIPTHTSRSSGYTTLADSSNPRGMQRGVEYKVFATFYQEAPQGFVGVPSRQRSITMLTDAGASSDIYSAAPDVAGATPLTLTFTVPTSGNWYLRIHNGGQYGDPSTFWDNIAIIAMPYGGGYFSGATPDADGIDYRWFGAEGESISYMVLPGSVGGWENYCDINWHETKNQECYDNLHFALEEDVAYEAQYIPEDAPWYSRYSGYVYPSSPSRKFLGAYALSVSALSDSSRSVPITEGIINGGVLGRERLAVPRFRFRVMLTAVDEEGLEYGKAWLSKALSEQACSTHGASCGSSDLTFLVACPPKPDDDAPLAAFSEKVDSLTRMYHDVKCIEGPVTVDQFQRPENSWGAIVEFTLAAGVASMFGIAAPWLPVQQISETIVQDIPLNYLPYPSAEIAGADVTVATNYSLNPSVESNSTLWAAQADGTNITAGMITSGRVTGELSAVGTSSFRVVFTATGAGTNGTFAAQQEVDVSTRPTGASVSINLWGAEALISGAPVRGAIEFTAIWRSSAGGATLRTDTLGTAPVTGGSVTTKSIVPPAGATHVLVRALARLTSWPAGTVVRLYADALSVTVP